MPSVKSVSNGVSLIVLPLSASTWTTVTLGSFFGAFLPPTTNQRTYDGTVTIPNMKYVVFGGLESEANGNVESKARMPS